ncbi:flagellar biosynthesis protein FliQ [Salipaludibacillus agaradhaerens]|jgi:flagellar biosynthetic protein FliQ|uniref:Flagellar biosynthetic protein FliQ n=1 Tax=Salipaludibacillus agaradhaerens TaxID=76935 RepID=A0A9Q4B0R6_SALAG|nr:MULTISPECIES: flagellar biosynthesis protein FliQ [Salipaludibacillus]UJW58138.1 flagellar biosynthesis protein FliQ [Bacillus sp. A116_S68]MCR6096056.1 flagellar biosynthesis protein FliQ [Salipaludibacillus agaradhaerens]MCR6107056.1 flagellar biosynthesis protein FliQ [Salipaludibacillus agaradhaerens]MCR6114385.1 flagellar biosynthesis protein FliQ [Salipaludibacillus agaradhaerens]MCR6119087.1 flagellar biosynthesis protein FliQ [Salipaludibacillus agaradhaerens]
MSPEMVISWAEQGVFTILLISGPLLITALGIGLAVSIFQATTQIQEQTLAFIPKIAGVLIALVIFGPWMLSQALSLAEEIFSNLHQFIG